MARLSPEQIVFNLSKIPGWTLQGGHSIERILSFPDFKSAIQFANQIVNTPRLQITIQK